MNRRTLTVSEARKQLPRLLRAIAAGGGPFYLGARGQATAVLVSLADHEGRGAAGVIGEGLAAWEPLRLEIVGTPDDVAADLREIRRGSVASVVEGWDRANAPAVPPRPAPRRRARP